jgi:hypothetical protein
MLVYDDLLFLLVFFFYYSSMFGYDNVLFRPKQSGLEV